MDLRVCFGAINLVVWNQKEHKDLKLKQELQELNHNITSFFFNFFFFQKKIKIVKPITSVWDLYL